MAKNKKKTALLALALAGAAISGLTQSPLVVSDATSILSTDAGSVYRITGPGMIATVATGAPLQSPSGVLFRGTTALGEEFFVADIGTFFAVNDGAIHLIGDGRPTEVVYQGAPLSNPFGLLALSDHRLLVGDFGNPSPGTFDGTVFIVNLDPDGDNVDGPFPLPAAAIQPAWQGAPLQGVNELAWRVPDYVVMLADDSGSLYQFDLDTLAAPTPFGPAFVDPVGLAPAQGGGFIVADAGAQQIYFVDDAGQNANLLLGGTFVDQFLGVAVDALDGTIAVPNAHDLFGGAADGEVHLITPGGTSILFSGPPLITPMAAAFPHPPQSPGSPNSPNSLR